MSSLCFQLSSSNPGPRVGTLIFTRQNENEEIRIPTPNFIASTSRGVVPHLSIDNVARTKSIGWVHVPFETFLEHSPPVPTLIPLHTLLCIPANRHILSLSLRDPSSSREMPPNTNTYVTANTIRGVRRVTPSDYKSYAAKANPDVVWALTDNVYGSTNASGPKQEQVGSGGLGNGVSQKRNIKSVERSLAWLGGMLAADSASPRPITFVSLVGGSSIPARKGFANGLTETLYGPEAEQIKPLKTLDEGVSGYVVELVPMVLGLGVGTLGREAVTTMEKETTTTTTITEQDTPTSTTTTTTKTLSTSISTTTTKTSSPLSSLKALIPLINSSISSLPTTKPRLVFGGSAAPNALGSSVGPRTPIYTPTFTPSASTPTASSTPTTQPTPTSVGLMTGTDTTPPTQKPTQPIPIPILTPHLSLLLLLHCGIDVFDSKYPEEAASVGVALGFRFPAPYVDLHANGNEKEVMGGSRRKLPLGYNLYDSKYRMDFRSVGAGGSEVDVVDGGYVGVGWRGTAEPLSPPSSRFTRGQDVNTDENASQNNKVQTNQDHVCLCPTCSPLPPQRPEDVISHSLVDSFSLPASHSSSDSSYKPPYTRAYLHHLLHTHEMSAHSLLVMHNLEVWGRFWEGVREVISLSGKHEGDGVEGLKEEVERFFEVYGDGGLGLSVLPDSDASVDAAVGETEQEDAEVVHVDVDVVEEARTMWHQVELLRGKGRLAREKAKEMDKKEEEEKE